MFEPNITLMRSAPCKREEDIAVRFADRSVSYRETDCEETRTMGDSDGNDPIRVQYGALPHRISSQGLLEVLLITSRDTGRWVIPKGWPMRGKTGPEAAAQEAFEEAGVVGLTDEVSVGAYHYRKRLRRGARAICRVEVFSLSVLDEMEDWPEKSQRTRSWFHSEKAAELVDERELRDLILMAGNRAWPD